MSRWRGAGDPLSSRKLRVLGAGLAVLAATAGPSCSPVSSGDLQPRYVALHNAFAAMGLAAVGPLQQASLAEGREVRMVMDLSAQCTTIVALGGAGVRDVDATLVDNAGKPIAHDTTREPQAVLRPCLESAGTYTLVVRMAAGAGDVLAASWAGSVQGGAGSGPSPVAVVEPAGTCDAPIPLQVGTVTGNTAHGQSELEGSCANSASREIVYRLEVSSRQKISVDVDPHFDAVLYIRKGECADSDAEVACNDDAPKSQRRSHIDAVLEPGVYFVIVDGYNNESGSFRMTTSLAEVPSLSSACQRGRPLALGAVVTGSTSASFDEVHAACGEEARAADVIYTLDVPQRSRVRLTEKSSDLTPVVHVRTQCDDERTELACSDHGMADGEAGLVHVFEPGRYAVFADGSDRDESGAFTLQTEAMPEPGAGTSGDSCADATPLSPGENEVEGDTFAARDDIAGQCGGAGAPDVVYRVEVARRSKFSVRMASEEGSHAFVLMRTCGDRGGEIACGGSIDEVLAPGSYFLAVDGAEADDFGRFAFLWRMRDVAAQEASCRNAPLLVEGKPLNGTTSNVGDHFNASCAGRDDVQASSDRIYRLALRARSHVRLSLTTPTWDGVLALRRACVDGTSPPRSIELACNNDADDTHHARLDATLDPGTYYVLVDGHATGNDGAFTLEYDRVR